MTSKLKVNILADGGDNAIMTSDGSGALTLNNAALKNTPAFQASLSSSVSLSDNTQTKMQADTENLDTDNCYDNSTNYRFTPTIAGKYFCYGQVNIQGGTINTIAQIYLRKNGSTVKMSIDRYAGDGDIIAQVQAIIEFNGSSDYFEAFVRQNTGGAKNMFDTNSFFGAYRLVGA